MDIYNKINQEFDFYKRTSKEELKYLQHNKKRYIWALMTLAKLTWGEKIVILDIGTSPFTFLLKRIFPKSNIITIDLTFKFKAKAEKNGIKFFKVDLNKENLLVLKQKFDIVFFLEVIEHLKKNQKKILNQIEKILKVGGICLVQTPNRECLKNRLLKKWRLLDKLVSKFTVHPTRQPGDVHFKEYTKEEFTNLVRGKTNLEIIEQDYPLYFDSLSSALAFRKMKLFFFPLAVANLFLVTCLPHLRRGMQFVLKKK